MLTFKVCSNNVEWLPEVLCPKDKLHGHFWANSHFAENQEIPITLFPIITNKDLALQLLFELGDLLTQDALEHHPVMNKVQNEIAESILPEGDSQ